MQVAGGDDVHDATGRVDRLGGVDGGLPAAAQAGKEHRLGVAGNAEYSIKRPQNSANSWATLQSQGFPAMLPNARLRTWWVQVGLGLVVVVEEVAGLVVGRAPVGTEKEEEAAR